MVSKLRTSLCKADFTQNKAFKQISEVNLEAGTKNGRNADNDMSINRSSH